MHWSGKENFTVKRTSVYSEQDRNLRRQAKQIRKDLENNAEAMKALDGDRVDLRPEPGVVSLAGQVDLLAPTLSKKPWTNGILRYEPASGQINSIELQSEDGAIRMQCAESIDEVTTVSWERIQPADPYFAPTRLETLMESNFPQSKPFDATGLRATYVTKTGSEDIEVTLSSYERVEDQSTTTDPETPSRTWKGVKEGPRYSGVDITPRDSWPLLGLFGY